MKRRRDWLTNFLEILKTLSWVFSEESYEKRFPDLCLFYFPSLYYLIASASTSGMIDDTPDRNVYVSRNIFRSSSDLR